MKIFHNKALSTLILLLFSISAFSGPTPPAPEGIPDPPPDLPIDENLLILSLTALIFGLYTINKHILNRKTPI